jgi:protein-lysine N-methyltransferase EEF2KMT
VYDPSIILPLVETLRLALQLGNGNTQAIIALTERNLDTLTQFVQAASTYNIFFVIWIDS